jgi:hypothetical protein
MIRPAPALLVASALLLTVTPARAQDTRPLTVAAGVTTLREQPPGGFEAQTYDTGWAVAVSYTVWKGLGGAFDFGANRKTNVVGEKQELSYYLVGPRYDILPTPWLRAFGHVLFGRETFTEPGFTEDGFAIQPGGGVDVYAWRGAGARVQVDYRTTDYDGARFKDWRVFVGGVYAFGW